MCYCYIFTHPGKSALFRVGDVDEFVPDGLLQELGEGGRELLADDVVVGAHDDDGAIGRPSLDQRCVSINPFGHHLENLT